MYSDMPVVLGTMHRRVFCASHLIRPASYYDYMRLIFISSNGILFFFLKSSLISDITLSSNNLSREHWC